MSEKHLISYINFGADSLARNAVNAVEGFVQGISASGNHRAAFRISTIQRPTTAEDLSNALNRVNEGGDRPFITIVDGHGGYWGRNNWCFSRTKHECEAAELKQIANTVRFETDILFVTACNSLEGLVEWREIVGPDCDIVLSRTDVGTSDFFRLFCNFMLAAVGLTGDKKITPANRRGLWDKALDAFRIQETGKRGKGMLYQYERFAIDLQS